MKLTCDIVETLQQDFNALWRCQQRGNTVEISVPYLLPDSTLVSLFLTQRNERIIVCDSGGIMEFLSEHCPLPEDEFLPALREMASKFGVKEGRLSNAPLFFKECTNPKLISSLVFDVASFVTMAASALVSVGIEDPETVRSTRFESQADSFIRSIKPADLIVASSTIPEVPGFRFSSVLRGPESRTWLISYISGSNLTTFRKNVNDTAKSFKHAWESNLGPRIARTIPLLNNEASGYDPDKLDWQIRDLQADAHNSLVRWTNKEELKELLRS